ncbi:MAG: DUF3482 domain-containing protein, partial [Phycisphaerales bacterium]|nr:DUF3482 domain-containing protein [Phycisphaerales bacterium]
LVDGVPMVELYDTPGLEDSIGLLEHLDAVTAGARIDGPDQIQQFLESPAARHDFAQEAKALRQVLASHVALYVIDARERVLGKHRDELEILARCARPVVPVLNFVASDDNRIAEWREQLARVNLHAVAEFDTVVVDDDGERRLFEKIGTLADSFRATIDRLVADRQAHRRTLLHGAAEVVAELLIDVSAYCEVVSTSNRAALDEATASMRQRVRRREHEAVGALLALFRFRDEDCRAAELPIEEGAWGLDLFSPEALRVLGVKAGRSAATGAMIGLSLDILSAGLSLGTGTAIGAALGAAFEGTRAHGKRLVDRLRGRSELRCADSTLRVLLARQVWLVQTLVRRGHAAMTPVEMSNALAESSADGSALPEPIRTARVHAHWSTLGAGDERGRMDPARAITINRLRAWLEDRFRSVPARGG